MALLYGIFAVLIIACISIGWLAHRQRWSVIGGPRAWGTAAARRFGPTGGALLVLLPGWAVVAGAGLALGFLAKNIEGSVDRPVFDWVHPRVSDELFTRLNEKLTYMGNNPIVELVCLLSVIVLACAYKRRWWLPTVAIVVAFLDEKLLWKMLGKVVDRGHPPTTHGTYPSGGVGRLLAIYAVVLVLAIMLLPALSRAWRAGLWTGLVTAGVVESYSRVYLSKHWFTDAVFALPLGGLLLLTNVAAVAAFAYRGEVVRHRAPAAGRAGPERTLDAAVTSPQS